MKENKLLWCYAIYSDKNSEQGSWVMHFARGAGGNSKFLSDANRKKIKKYRSKQIAKNTGFPFVGLYWYSPYSKKQIYDIVTMGDYVDKHMDGSKGAANSISWLNAKIKNFKSKGKYDVKTGTFTL